LMLSTREWQEHNKALKDALLDRKKVEDEISRLSSEERWLQRLQDALPKIAERKELLSKLDEMKDIVLLDPNFSEERRRAVDALNHAKREVQKAEQALGKIQNEEEGLSIPEQVLEQEEVITGLHERIRSYQDAQRDKPKREGELRQVEDEARSVLSELRPDLELEQASELKINKAKRVRIYELVKKLEALMEEEKRLGNHITDLTKNLESAKDELKKLHAPRDPAKLESAVRRAQSQGDIEKELDTLNKKLEQEIEQAEIGLQSLPQWSGDLDKFEVLPVPSSDTVERFKSNFEEVEKKLHGIAQNIDEKKGEIDKFDMQINALQKEGSVPTEEELIEARKSRENIWALVKRAWLDNEDVEKEKKAFNLDQELPEAYEMSVNGADEIADRLRREADRVARQAELIAGRDNSHEKLDELHEQHRDISDQLSTLESEWSECWSEAGIQPLTPKEMLSWLKKHEQLVGRAKTIRDYKAEVRRHEKKVHDIREEINSCLEELGEDKAPEKLSISSLMDRCHNLTDYINRLMTQRNNLREKIKELEDDIETAVREREKTEKELTELREKWSEEVKTLGLEKDASSSEVAALLESIQELFQKIDDTKQIRRRIDGINKIIDGFEKDTINLCENVAPELQNKPANQAASELNSRIQKARQDNVKRKELGKNRLEKEDALQEARDTIKEMTGKLDEMCNKAGCSEYDEIEEAERRSESKRILQERISQLEKDLQEMAHGGGMRMEELIKKSEEVDPDSLPAYIEKIQIEIEEYKNERDRHLEKITTHKNELEKMDGNQKAAETAEKAQAILAQIGERVEDYLCLHMASAILSQEIECYREANQGPILMRASQFFSKITLGSFSGLKTSYDMRDNPILVGVRPSGDEITVDGMSDGTSDQLYLSLRLASLEKHLDENEPMPFILDDILIQFDDDRAIATLKVLAELSNKTQIIFFTHHTHLLDLAKKTVPKKVLYEHQLINH